MKNFKFTLGFAVFATLFMVNTSSYAQLTLPRGSQKATVSQTVGISDISITYSRPSVKGREYGGN